MVLKVIGIIGFFIFLMIIYRSKHGIPGMVKYDADFKLLDMRFHYNNHTIYTTFESLGKAGIVAYQHYLIIDFLFICCFLITMLTINESFINNSIQKYGTTFCVLRALFDSIENSLLLVLIHQFPYQSNLLGNICSWMTTCKFLALYSWILLIVFSVIK